MIKLDIKSDVKQAERFLRNVRAGAVRRAAARAINDALITVRADGAREIKKQHPALPIGDIKRNMVMDSAFWKNLTGKVETKGKPLSLKLFRPGGGRKTKRGTSPVTAMVGPKRAVMQRHGRKAFRVAAYGDEIFVRTNARGRQMRKLRGPGMPNVFRAQGEKFRQIAIKRWAVTFPNRLKYEIERAKQL